MFFGKEGIITLNVVTITRRICEEVESVLDYGFTDLNMRLGVMNLTHHMLNVESFCSSAVNGDSDSECQLIYVLTETDHTVLLFDKYWPQAVFLVMSFSETAVRQLQCERSDENLVTTSFIGAGSLIQKGPRSREVCGYGEHWNETTWQIFQRQPEMCRERSAVSRATLQIWWSSLLGCLSYPFQILFWCGCSAARGC